MTKIIDDTEEVTKCYQGTPISSSSSDLEDIQDEDSMSPTIYTTLRFPGNVYSPLAFNSQETVPPDISLNRTSHDDATIDSLPLNPQSVRISGVQDVGGLLQGDHLPVVQVTASPDPYVLPFSLG